MCTLSKKKNQNTGGEMLVILPSKKIAQYEGKFNRFTGGRGRVYSGVSDPLIPEHLTPMWISTA